MIAKYINSFNLFLMASCFRDDLADCSIMVQSAEAGDVLLLDCWCEVTEDVGVAVGWICHHDASDIGLGNRKGLCLLHKDFLVYLKQILAFHSWLAGESSEEDYDVSVLELLLGLVAIADLSYAIFTDLTSG